MGKVYISWQATINDHQKDSRLKVDTSTSPNYNFHKQKFYEEKGYDKHIILSSAKEDEEPESFIRTQCGQLLVKLKQDFKDHNIEMVYLNLENFKDLTEVYHRVEALVLENREHELHFSVSSGHRIMLLVNTLLHIQKRQLKNSKIIQIESIKENWTFKTLDIKKSNDAENIIIKSIEEKTQDYSRRDAPSMKHIYEQVENLAICDYEGISLLIEGESGTGKEDIARCYKEHSPRRKNYFAINCGAYEDGLLRSELFGAVKGGYTDATDRKGFFEKADKGILFLDEIGEITPYMQSTLLRVLQSGEFYPVGSADPKKVDVKIIAATNKNLIEECKKGKFRQDLLYRLSTKKIYVPSLRDRGIDEIEVLIKRLNTKFSEKYGVKKLTITSNAMKKLLAYSYPGNIRELQNMVLSFYADSKKKIDVIDLPNEVVDDNSETSFSIKEMEKKHYKKTVEHFRGQNKKMMYEALGVNFATFESKIKKWGINVN